MKLEDLLAEVSCRREAARLEREAIVEQQRAIEVQRLEKLRESFYVNVRTAFGDILDALNAEPKIECLNRELECWFEFKHIRVSIFQTYSKIEGREGDNPGFGISATVGEGYFSNLKVTDLGSMYFPLDQALAHLRDLIFDIHQEYDRLLPDFEIKRKLADYRLAIEEAELKSDEEVENLNTALKEWKWPEGRILNLHKISWAKHGFVDSQGEAYFDYDCGWALSDLPRSLNGYYDLLPQTGELAREVKPGYPVTVERFWFAENELPPELMEKPKQKLEIIKVHDFCREDYTKLLPQFLPEIPPELSGYFKIEPAIATFALNVPPVPCFEIRQELSMPIPDSDRAPF